MNTPIQPPPGANPFLNNLTMLVGVVLDDCRDLDVVHADASAHDVQISLANRDDMLRLASRLDAAPNVPDRSRWTATVAGVKVIVRSAS